MTMASSAPRDPRRTGKFHPYYSVHDIQGIAVFLFFFCGILFFAPEMGGFFLELANFEEANALKTPSHIAPVWYYTPYYSVLRAVPDKFWLSMLPACGS